MRLGQVLTSSWALRAGPPYTGALTTSSWINEPVSCSQTLHLHSRVPAKDAGQLFHQRPQRTDTTCDDPETQKLFFHFTHREEKGERICVTERTATIFGITANKAQPENDSVCLHMVTQNQTHVNNQEVPTGLPASVTRLNTAKAICRRANSVPVGDYCQLHHRHKTFSPLIKTSCKSKSRQQRKTNYQPLISNKNS